MKDIRGIIIQKLSDSVCFKFTIFIFRNNFPRNIRMRLLFLDIFEKDI